MHDTIAPTPEAVRHLNLDVVYRTNGEIISARTRNKTVMDRCVELGYLDPHHPEYATTFLALRMAWLAPVAYKASSLCDCVFSFFDGTPVSPSDVYDAVCRQLGRQPMGVIVWAATTPHQDYTCALSAISGGICNRAFLALERAMDAVNSDTKKRLRNNA